MMQFQTRTPAVGADAARLARATIRLPSEATVTTPPRRRRRRAPGPPARPPLPGPPPAAGGPGRPQAPAAPPRQESELEYLAGRALGAAAITVTDRPGPPGSGPETGWARAGCRDRDSGLGTVTRDSDRDVWQ